jgi:ABC-2 type transport system ATP-binding protein
MNAASPRLQVRDLSKSYGQVAAVRRATLTVAAGEIFGLVGVNGAGKTTLLECILGLRRPDFGSVEVDGIDALREPAAALKRIGAQLQTMELQDAVTPREALALFAAFYRKPIPPSVLIERFGLSEKADARFATLSGGQRRRVGLALAFVNNPRLVILDEPTAGLDPAARRGLRELIRSAREDSRAILLSTHDLEEAEHICDRIGVLDAGRLIASGPSAELIGRSGARRRVWFEPRLALAPERLGELGGVTACQREGAGWLLRTTDVNQTTADLAALMQAEGNELRELRVQPPTLEDAFFELTAERRRKVAA